MCVTAQHQRALPFPREMRAIALAAWQTRPRPAAAVPALPAPAPPAALWPVAKRARVGPGQSLQEKEEADRTKLLQKLGREIQELDLPAASWLNEENFEKRIHFLGKGLRLGTLRARLRSWRHVRQWLEAAKDASWPRNAYEVLEYLESRAAEPCGPSCMTSALSGLSFMERSGQVHFGDRLGSSEFLRDASQELVRRLQQADPKERRQANQLLASILASWERITISDALPAYTRFWAWARLLKVWGALRSDDLKWADPASAHMTESGLECKLLRTKVSGPGKKVTHLSFSVSREAYFVEPRWLHTGFAVWQALCANSPFFISKPSKDLEHFTSYQAGYREASLSSQALFRLLTSVGVEKEALLPEGGGLFWTEHSERNWLPSVAASLGESRDLINRLGRWQAECSEHYVRTTRQAVEAFQVKVASRVRERTEDFIGESAVIERFLTYTEQREWSSAADHEAWASRLFWFFRPAGLPAPILPEAIADASDNEAKDSQLEGFIVSITGTQRRRRLHYIGRCWRVPGVHYAEYIAYGEEFPPADAYHAVCKLCWPLGACPPAASSSSMPRASSPAASSSRTSSASSSSSSS